MSNEEFFNHFKLDYPQFVEEVSTKVAEKLKSEKSDIQQVPVQYDKNQLVPNQIAKKILGVKSDNKIKDYRLNRNLYAKKEKGRYYYKVGDLLKFIDKL